MKNRLRGFTTAELAAELQRRQGDTKLPGADWYYFLIEEDGETLFGIVHRRFWHRRHCLSDHHLSGIVTMPDGFAECMESHFDFSRSIAEGERLLQESGFTKLENPLLWESQVTHFIDIAGAFNFRINCSCDTPTLKRFIKHVSLPVTRFANLDQYRHWVMGHLPYPAHFETFREYPQGCYACLMRQEVADSLPPYPEEMHD